MDFIKDKAIIIVSGVIALILAIVGATMLMGQSSSGVLGATKSDITVNKGVSMIVLNINGSLDASITHSPLAVTKQDKLNSDGDVVIESANIPWQKTLYVKDLPKQDIHLDAKFNVPALKGSAPRSCSISINGVTVSNSQAGSAGNTSTDTELHCTAPWAMVSAMLTPPDQKAGELPKK